MGVFPKPPSDAVSSVPLPALALACFSPFAISDSWLPPLSTTLLFCLLEEPPGKGPSPERRLRALACSVARHSSHLYTAPCPASSLWPKPSCPLPWNCQHPRGAADLASSPSLCSPCSSPSANPLGCGEATEPGHVSWPQAGPSPWLQSHTGQAQLRPLKSPETWAKLPHWAASPPLHLQVGNPTPVRSRSPL